MTHDELLAKMAEPAHNLIANDARNVYLLALRAVVELHKPWERDKYYCGFCTTEAKEANGGSWTQHLKYPCGTIQAIEKELS